MCDAESIAEILHRLYPSVERIRTQRPPSREQIPVYTSSTRASQCLQLHWGISSFTVCKHNPNPKRAVHSVREKNTVLLSRKNWRYLSKQLRNLSPCFLPKLSDSRKTRHVSLYVLFSLFCSKKKAILKTTHQFHAQCGSQNFQTFIRGEFYHTKRLYLMDVQAGCISLLMRQWPTLTQLRTKCHFQ